MLATGVKTLYVQFLLACIYILFIVIDLFIIFLMHYLLFLVK